jgi:hypothetical protein
MTGNQKGHFSRKILTLCQVHTHHLVGIMFSEACVVIVYISQSACGMHHVEQRAVN